MKKSSVIKISYCEKQEKFLCQKSQKQADKNVEKFKTVSTLIETIYGPLIWTFSPDWSIWRESSTRFVHDRTRLSFCFEDGKELFPSLYYVIHTYELESKITFLFSLHVSST